LVDLEEELDRVIALPGAEVTQVVEVTGVLQAVEAVVPTTLDRIRTTPPE
jgi:hypothetical protein